MKAVNVGLLGVGYLGEFHLQKLLRIEKANFVGFFDPDRERSRDIQGRYRVKGFGDPLSLLEKCDACIVAAPTSLHYSLAREALLRGKHVLVEKPLCEKISEAEELVDLSKRMDLILQVGHVERFNHAVRRLVSHAIPPFYLEARRESTPTQRALSVDVAMDLLIHDIDILLWCQSLEPEVVDAIGLSKIGKDWDLVSCWVSFRDGSKAFLISSRISTRKFRELRLFTEKGHFSVDCIQRSIEEFSLCGDPLRVDSEKCQFADSDPLWEEDTHFLDSICEGRMPLVTGEDGLRALKVIDEIKKRLRESA
ncbi:MAG: Gfo/Idh/MocA family protein [Desulfatiglandales bacterium]